MSKIKKQLNSLLPLKNIGVVGCFAVLAMGIFVALVVPFRVVASSVAEEFESSEAFREGTLVSVRRDQPSDIELANVSNSDYLLGAVEVTGQDLLTFSREDAKVTVAVRGDVPVYVTDANGPIKKGDFIGASWIDGVGMKALTQEETKLLGIALNDFDGAEGQEYPNIETPNGKKTVKVGSIAVRLFERQAIPSEASMTGLEQFVSKLAGREVSFMRVFASVAIFIIGIILCGILIFSAIRTSFISIGRNPLASSSIYTSLLHVSGLSVGIILIAASFAYVVLIV